MEITVKKITKRTVRFEIAGDKTDYYLNGWGVIIQKSPEYGSYHYTNFEYGQQAEIRARVLELIPFHRTEYCGAFETKYFFK